MAQKKYPKSDKAKRKIKKVLSEFSAGDLHSGSKKGPKVVKKSQAVAIALSEGRRVGKKKKS